MDVAHLQKLYVDFGNSIYREGYLDEYFTQLQEAVGEDCPMFVQDVISNFLKTSEQVLNDLTNMLENPVIDYNEVMTLIVSLQGGSCSVGAKKLSKVCITFNNYCKEKNLEGCVMSLHQVKHEFSIWRSKIEPLLTMQQQIMEAGGEVPIIV